MGRQVGFLDRPRPPKSASRKALGRQVRFFGVPKALSWLLGPPEASKTSFSEGFGPPSWALKRALGRRIWVLERFGLPSWPPRRLQEVPKSSPRYPKESPMVPKRSPKDPQGSPRGPQELPKSSPRAHVDPKKHSKGCPRALKRRKERIC